MMSLLGTEYNLRTQKNWQKCQGHTQNKSSLRTNRVNTRWSGVAQTSNPTTKIDALLPALEEPGAHVTGATAGLGQ
jgi:hypothetical protein